MGEHCVESDFIREEVNEMVGDIVLAIVALIASIWGGRYAHIHGLYNSGDIVSIGIMGAFMIIQIGRLRRRNKE